MKRTITKAMWAGCAVVALLLALPAAADTTYDMGDLLGTGSFTLVAGTGKEDLPAAQGVAPLLSVDVNEGTLTRNGQSFAAAFFTFSLDPGAGVGTKTDISEIYFDLGNTGNLLNLNTFNDAFGTADTHWTTSTELTTNGKNLEDISPGHLSGGNAITFSAEAGADSGNQRGVQGGENATFAFALGSSSDYEDLMAAMADPVNLRFGVHVRAIGTNGISASYWAPNPMTPVVPVPAAAGLGVLGMSLLGFMRRRKVVA